MVNLLLDQYFKIQKENERRFGEKTIVLMKVGSFYEMYKVFDLGKAQYVAEILGLHLPKKKNKLEESYTNPHLSGFPDKSLEKYLPRIIDSGWTVVIVDQFDKENTNEKERKITGIYSPSTYIDSYTNTNNYIMGIDYETVNNKNYIYISIIDFTTGKIQVLENFDTENYDCLINFRRHMYAYNPSEILINTNNKNKKLYDNILNNINTNTKIIHKLQMDNNYKKVNYQQQFLTKIYGEDNNIILERNPELLSITLFTIQFAYEHNPTLINKLSKPEIITDDNLLILNNDAIFQLNIINQNKSNKDCLLKLVDKTSTNIGKRNLKERLLRPITSINELNKRYNIIEYFKNNDEKINKIKKILMNIDDIEKKHRKVDLNRLNFNEFIGLQNTYMNILLLLEECDELINTENLINNNNNKINNKIILTKLKKFYDKCQKTFNFDLSFSNEDKDEEDDEEENKIEEKVNNFFKMGIYTDLDEYQKQLIENKTKLNKMCEDISKEIGIQKCVNLTEDYKFATTLKRASNLSKNKNYHITNFKSKAKFFTNESITISEQIINITKEINKLCIKRFEEWIQQNIQKYKNLFKIIIKLISYIDIGLSSAIIAIKNVYNRPTINDNEKSYLKCENIRHPIIEQTIKNEYIGNNIELNTQNNILLFGVNGSGKSSLLRSVGCNIVLAQAGLYVASSNFEYYPYKDLLCKISCKDDLYNGESTFISELLELDNILKKANKNSLVLGDELCNGTESDSASSIVATTIEELIKKNVSYIISTHVHQIIKYKDIQKLIEENKLNIKHIKIQIENKKIVNRELLDGNGSELYGVEIMEMLSIFDSKLIKRIYEYRKLIDNEKVEILTTKTSRYNSKLYMDKCERCGTKNNLQTHHKKEQHTADKFGIIENKFHKNAIYNLEVLCDECHTNHHNHHHD